MLKLLTLFILLSCAGDLKKQTTSVSTLSKSAKLSYDIWNTSFIKSCDCANIFQTRESSYQLGIDVDELTRLYGASPKVNFNSGVIFITETVDHNYKILSAATTDGEDKVISCRSEWSFNSCRVKLDNNDVFSHTLKKSAEINALSFKSKSVPIEPNFFDRNIKGNFFYDYDGKFNELFSALFLGNESEDLIKDFIDLVKIDQSYFNGLFSLAKPEVKNSVFYRLSKGSLWNSLTYESVVSKKDIKSLYNFGSLDGNLVVRVNNEFHWFDFNIKHESHLNSEVMKTSVTPSETREEVFIEKCIAERFNALRDKSIYHFVSLDEVINQCPHYENFEFNLSSFELRETLYQVILNQDKRATFATDWNTILQKLLISDFEKNISTKNTFSRQELESERLIKLEKMRHRVNQSSKISPSFFYKLITTWFLQNNIYDDFRELTLTDLDQVISYYQRQSLVDKNIARKLEVFMEKPRELLLYIQK